MGVVVHRDALVLPGWVPAWGHGFGDLVALIYMNLIGKCVAYEPALEEADCRSWRQGRQAT